MNIMRTQPVSIISSVALTATTLLAPIGTAAFAATTAPMQNLTSLATVSTAVTGQPDPTFSNLEKSYPAPPTSTTAWAGYCRQGGRTITLQFPQYVDVTKIQITMELNKVKGIYPAKQVTFQAASYGQWYSLDTEPLSTATSSSSGNETFTFDSPGFTTNEIQISFPVSIWVFAQGLHVYGSTTTPGTGLNTLGYKMIQSTAQNSRKPLTPNAPNAYGIRNMLLVQTYGHGNLGTWSSTDFAPMIGHVNDFGYMDAPMFDTMLFLPYTLTNDTESYWTNYMNDLFSANSQLGALNQAVATTNQTLGRPGYKEKVVLSIPYFSFETNNFGTINGQAINFGGSATDPNAVAARTTALNWYVTNLLSRWQAANYQNLQLVGLYWDEEQYKVDSPGERPLLDAGESLAQKNNLPLFWIPFYGANESNNWSQLGFNTAWLQSNYIEQGANATVTRITNAMNEATQTGMGIEVELTALDNATAAHYLTFLQTLDNNGFGGTNVSHAYYDGSKLLLDSERSIDPSVRKLYDETASFILTGING